MENHKTVKQMAYINTSVHFLHFIQLKGKRMAQITRKIDGRAYFFIFKSSHLRRGVFFAGQHYLHIDVIWRSKTSS